MKKRALLGCALAISCIVAGALFTGCGGSGSAPAAKPATTTSAPAATAVSGLKSPIFEQPVLITSVGQSADAQMVKALADRSKLQYKFDTAAKPEALQGNKTLLLAIGGSSKGMGAAGVNQAQEMDRAKALIAKAKEMNIKILAVHVGGAARRGDLTDRFIPLAGDASYLIVVADGDNDKIFTKLASSKKMPIDFPTGIADAGKYLKAAFK
jgi:hypothetical protein